MQSWYFNVQSLLKHFLWIATVRKKCFASNRFSFSCYPINDSMTHTSYPLTFSAAKHFAECLVIEHIFRKVQILSSCIKSDYLLVCKCHKWFRAVYCRLCLRLLRTWSIHDFQTLAQKNCVTNEPARKHATIVLKGYVNAIIAYII